MLSLAWALFLSAECLALSSECGEIENVYQNSLKKKIESGIPFELAAILSADDKAYAKIKIHIAYDLWDEVVNVTENGSERAQIKLGEMFSFLCSKIGLTTLSQALKKGKEYDYIILLNPFWGKRIQKLKGLVKPQDGSIISFDWEEVSARMKKDQILTKRKVVL